MGKLQKTGLIRSTTIVVLGAFALQLVAPGFSTVSSARADSTALPPKGGAVGDTEKGAPGSGGVGDPCDVVDESAASEQCNVKKLAITTAVIQGGEALAFTTAATLCTVACVAQAADKAAGKAAKEAAEAADKFAQTTGPDIKKHTEPIQGLVAKAKDGLEASKDCGLPGTGKLPKAVPPGPPAVTACTNDASERTANKDFAGAAKATEGSTAAVAYNEGIVSCVESAAHGQVTMVKAAAEIGLAQEAAAELVAEEAPTVGMGQTVIKTGEAAFVGPSPSEASEVIAEAAADALDKKADLMLTASNRLRDQANNYLQDQTTGAIQFEHVVLGSASKLAEDEIPKGACSVISKLTDAGKEGSKEATDKAGNAACAQGVTVIVGTVLAPDCLKDLTSPAKEADSACAAASGKLQPLKAEAMKMASGLTPIVGCPGLPGAPSVPPGEVEVYKDMTTLVVTTAKAAHKARTFRESTRTACKIGNYAALGVDVAGGIATTVAGAAITKKIDAGSITGLTTTVAMDVAQQTLNKTDNDKGSQQEEINCPLEPITHFLQAGIRGVNMGMSIAKANEASHYALELRVYKGGSSPTQVAKGGGAASGGGDNSGSAGPEQAQDPKMLRDLPAADKKKFTAANFAASSATAGEAKTMAPALLEATTGHSAEELNNRLLNGESPMEAAMAISGAQMGSMLPIVAALHQNKDQLYKELAPEMEQVHVSKNDFDSGKGGSAKHHSSSSDGMPDMSALLAGLQGKQKEAGPPGSKTVAFGQGAKTSGVSADGLHPASKSLFDIIGTRYQLVQKRFLAGEATGMDQAPSSVPKNIYLRK